MSRMQSAGQARYNKNTVMFAAGAAAACGLAVWGLSAVFNQEPGPPQPEMRVIYEYDPPANSHAPAGSDNAYDEISYDGCTLKIGFPKGTPLEDRTKIVHEFNQRMVTDTRNVPSLVQGDIANQLSYLELKCLVMPKVAPAKPDLG